jgi:L-lysine exporter family protein LysE/ArgO
MVSAFPAGFALSFSLILAIGAQNAFVLRQGLRREHVGVVILICCLSEAVLIFGGVAGFAAVAQAAPWALDVMRWAGAAFLLVYGLRSLWAARRPSAALVAAGSGSASLRAAVVTTLVLTWANPHVFLDTLGLLGAVATQYGEARWMFGAGALTASCVFFLLLGYGARILAPLFARPQSWQVLDAFVGVTMLILSAKLAMGF